MRHHDSGQRSRFSITNALLVLLLALCFLVSTAAATASCWTPNHEKTNANYVPCNPEAAASMCCATWDTCNNSTGLCFNNDYQLWWRESCTDPSWQSDACVKLFLTDSIDDISITNCSDGTWCPFTNATSVECCNNGQGVFLNGTRPGSTSSTPSVPTSTATSPATPKSTNTTTPPDPEVKSTALSSGAKAGIGIGAALGAASIGLVVVACLWRRRQRRPRSDQMDLGPFTPVEKSDAAISEIGTSQPNGLVEMPGPETVKSLEQPLIPHSTAKKPRYELS